MKNVSFYLGACLLIVITSCDSANNEEPLQPLLPIAVGNEWIMLRTDSITIAQTRQDTFRVVDHSVIGNEIWYTIENRDGNGLTPWSSERSSNRYSFRDDGIWRLTSEDEVIHVLRYPIEEGSTYEVRDGIASRLSSKNASLALPELGTLSAQQYSHTYAQSYRPFASDIGREYTDYPLAEEVTIESYFSSQFGILRLEAFYVSPNNEEAKAAVVGRVTWELLQFVNEGEK